LTCSFTIYDAVGQAVTCFDSALQCDRIRQRRRRAAVRM
jgi:hypothetical protein